MSDPEAHFDTTGLTFGIVRFNKKKCAKLLAASTLFLVVTGFWMFSDDFQGRPWSWALLVLGILLFAFGFVLSGHGLLAPAAITYSEGRFEDRTRIVRRSWDFDEIDSYNLEPQRLTLRLANGGKARIPLVFVEMRSLMLFFAVLTRGGEEPVDPNDASETR